MSRPVGLSLARGDVRDGVAAIEHFLQVLASRRVGSKVLARAVPEMAAGCAELEAALATLASAVAELLATDAEGVAEVRGLIGHAASRVAELSAALAALRGAGMEARDRLALEVVVRRVAGDLGAVVRLVELFGGPATSDVITIDFADALSARRAAARAGGSVVRASVEVRASELAVSDVRLVMGLLEQAVLVVARAAPPPATPPRIVVERGPEGFPVFDVGPALAGANVVVQTGRLTFEAPSRDALPHEIGVTLAAARHAGITFALADEGRRVTVAL